MPELSDVKIKISTEADNSGVDSAASKIKTFGENAVTASGVALAGFTALGGAAIALGKTSLDAWTTQEDALARLRQGLSNLTDDTDETNSAIQELSDQASSLQKVTRFSDDMIESGQAMLTTFMLSKDSIKQLTPSMLNMAEAFRQQTGQTMDLSQVAVMFGKVMGGAKDGIDGMATGLRKMGVIMTDEQQAVFKYGTEAERAATLTKIMDQNFQGFAKAGGATTSGKLEILKNQMGEVQEAIGQMVANAIVPMVDYLSANVVPAFDRFMTGLKAVFGFIQEHQGLIPIIAGTLMALLVPALWAIATAVWAAVAPLLPFYAIVLGIGALIAAVYLAWSTNFMGIRDIVFGFVEFVKNAFNSFVQFFVGLWTGIQTAIQNFVNWFQTVLVPALTTAFQVASFPFIVFWDLAVLIFAAIGAVMQAFIGWIGATFGPSFNAAMTFVKNILTDVSKFFSTIWTGIQTLLKAFGDWMGKTFNPIIDGAFAWIKNSLTTLKTFWDGIWNGISTTVSGIATKILDTVKGMINGVIDFFNGLIRGANNLGSKVPGFIKIPEIGHLAAGTNFWGGGMTWVGENGPEIVNLPRGSQVIPNNQTASVGSQIQVTQNIYGDVDMEMAMRQLAYAVATG